MSDSQGFARGQAVRHRSEAGPVMIVEKVEGDQVTVSFWSGPEKSGEWRMHVWQKSSLQPHVPRQITFEPAKPKP